MSDSLSAKRIIYLHKNPILGPASFGKKIFTPENTENELENINQALDVFKNTLSAERIEKKSARATAEWLPDLKLAKITKRIGHITQFGYKKDNDFFLLPEEALFLLELNRLELSYNEIPFSIEQAYMTLLGNETCSIKQYRIYQNLAKHGFHVKNIKEQKEDLKHDENSSKKIKLTKKDPKYTKNCYNIYSSDSSHKKLTHQLNLQLNNDSLNSESISTSDYSVLTSFSGVDSVAFYQLQAIDFDNK